MPPPTNSPRNAVSIDLPQPRRRVWPGRLLLLILLVLIGLVFWQRQVIADWFKLRDYQPPAQISSLADKDTMTPLAQHYFYLNAPAVENKTDFSKNCPTYEQTIVIGCYKSGESGIYLLSVTDPRLDGVMQVTAAHEMLHAAYERLPSSQKQTIDAELEDFYKHGLTDKNVKAEIASYQKTEPGQVVNEMHSIFGTEVADLPPALSSYYGRYFKDRKVVTDTAARYRGAFDSLLVQVHHDDAVLSNLKAQIVSNEAILNQKSAALSAEASKLLDLRRFGSVAAYNSGVAAYNQNVATFNALLGSTKSLIKQYNALVAKRNSVALAERQLVGELSAGNLPTSAD